MAYDPETTVYRIKELGFRCYHSSRAGDHYRSKKYKGVIVICTWQGAYAYRKQTPLEKAMKPWKKGANVHLFEAATFAEVKDKLMGMETK